MLLEGHFEPLRALSSYFRGKGMRSKKCLGVHLQKPMTFICDNYLLYSGYLIFCFWKVTLSLFGTYRSIFDEVLV